MAFTVLMIASRSDENGDRRSWPLGDPPRSFALAEQANIAGNEEAERIAAAGGHATFGILDADGQPVSHTGRRTLW